MSSGRMWLDLLLLVGQLDGLKATFLVMLFLYFDMNQKAIELNIVGHI